LTESDIVRSVDPNRVLAEAWHHGRLDQCRRSLSSTASGLRPTPFAVG
jgi:hypothetical protein